MDKPQKLKLGKLRKEMIECFNEIRLRLTLDSHCPEDYQIIAGKAEKLARLSRRMYQKMLDNGSYLTGVDTTLEDKPMPVKPAPLQPQLIQEGDISKQKVTGKSNLEDDSIKEQLRI